MAHALKKAIERAEQEERPKILNLDFLKKSEAQRPRRLNYTPAFSYIIEK